MPRWKSEFPVAITALEENLFAITTSWTAGSHGVKHLHAYYLVLPDMRLLFHGPDRVDFYKQHHAFFSEHGGIDRQVMNHGADASPACTYVEKTYGAPIYIHDDDVDHAIRKRKGPVSGSFSKSHSVTTGLEAIPLPGHTPGFTVFLWRAPGTRYLIAGDIIFEDPQSWTAFLGEGLYQLGARSLQRLGEIECDVLLPNETAGENTPPIRFGESERRAILQDVLRRVSRKYRVDA
jgi:glyoxylase-like metal-dependent hydrolase (beta-lactamase superfamily II)